MLEKTETEGMRKSRQEGMEGKRAAVCGIRARRAPGNMGDVRRSKGLLPGLAHRPCTQQYVCSRGTDAAVLEGKLMRA